MIDEVSMLGLKTLYEVDQRIRLLRGFPDKPFGGIPAVIFSGDFLQFGPVLQKSLLSNIYKITAAQAKAQLNERSVQSRWQQTQAMEVWQQFTNVVMLEEQKRAQGDTYLLGFLERFRAEKQTQEDAERLQARYDSAARLDVSNERRAIIPLNRHRWDITLHAALAYSTEKGRHLSIYLSTHEWRDRIPEADERRTAMLLGDEGKLAIPGVFPYVEGMPVIVNTNMYQGLKVVNGAEFTAVGIIHPPGLEEQVITDEISVFFGPPSGILLCSEATRHLEMPHLPPGTLLLPETSISLLEKYKTTLCPKLQTKKNIKLGINRTGLPCTPGLGMTDYKAQGRTLPRALLGLYGRKPIRQGQGPERCDTISMYVQISRVRRFEDINLIYPLNIPHFLEARTPEELLLGIERLKWLALDTTEAFEAKNGYQG